MAAVVTALVADNAKEFVPFLVKEAAKSQALGIRNFGHVLARVGARIEDGAREMDGNYLWENCNPCRFAYFALWSLSEIR